jgi:hypothetical protein
MKRKKRVVLIVVFACLFGFAFDCLRAEAQSFVYVTNILSWDVSVINTANFPAFPETPGTRRRP